MSNSGDIVLLKFNGNYKTRLLRNIVKQKHPVLVLQVYNSGNDILIASMSSQINNSAVQKYPHNVVLSDLTNTGLNKQTYVDTSSTGIIDSSNIYKTIGQVSTTDKYRIDKAFYNVNRRQLLETYKIYNTGNPEYLDYYLDENRRMIFLDVEK